MVDRAPASRASHESILVNKAAESRAASALAVYVVSSGHAAGGVLSHDEAEGYSSSPAANGTANSSSRLRIPVAMVIGCALFRFGRLTFPIRIRWQARYTSTGRSVSAPQAASFCEALGSPAYVVPLTLRLADCVCQRWIAEHSDRRLLHRRFSSSVRDAVCSQLTFGSIRSPRCWRGAVAVAIGRTASARALWRCSLCGRGDRAASRMMPSRVSAALGGGLLAEPFRHTCAAAGGPASRRTCSASLPESTARRRASTSLTSAQPQMPRCRRRSPARSAPSGQLPSTFAAFSATAKWTRARMEPRWTDEAMLALLVCYGALRAAAVRGWCGCPPGLRPLDTADLVLLVRLSLVARRLRDRPLMALCLRRPAQRDASQHRILASAPPLLIAACRDDRPSQGAADGS